MYPVSDLSMTHQIALQAPKCLYPLAADVLNDKRGKSVVKLSYWHMGAACHWLRSVAELVLSNTNADLAWGWLCVGELPFRLEAKTLRGVAACYMPQAAVRLGSHVLGHLSVEYSNGANFRTERSILNDGQHAV